MASDEALEVSAEQRETLIEQLEGYLGGRQMVTSMEASSSQKVVSDHESQSGDSEDSETGSDTSTCLKVAAAAALAGITYNFGQSTMMKTHLVTLRNHGHYFPKGYSRAPIVLSVPAPQADEIIKFKDFFTAGLHVPPHLVLLDILRKFWVQLYQVTLNVFAQHYELHYQNKKIQLEGSDSTLAAQFGCITFHPSRFGSWSRLTPAMRNKWTSGWDGNWFYCRVPMKQTADVRCKGTYPLNYTMIDYSKGFHR
jgi:hypothetical protein